MESKKYNKLATITKKKQACRCREQARGYQLVEAGKGEMEWGLSGTNC